MTDGSDSYNPCTDRPASYDEDNSLGRQLGAQLNEGTASVSMTAFNEYILEIPKKANFDAEVEAGMQNDLIAGLACAAPDDMHVSYKDNEFTFKLDWAAEKFVNLAFVMLDKFRIPSTFDHHLEPAESVESIVERVNKEMTSDIFGMSLNNATARHDFVQDFNRRRKEHNLLLPDFEAYEESGQVKIRYLGKEI
jgi:hypothetical protein